MSNKVASIYYMIYNLLEVLKDYEGKNTKIDETKEDSPPLDFKYILYTALNITTQQYPMTPEEKAKAFFVTQKAYLKPEECELTADEVSFVLSRIKKVYTPLVSGRDEEFFNQKN